MGKAPCCSKVGLHKGPWSTKEDSLLTHYIQTNGEGQWRSLPKKAGLLRCGKSCRLRWMNYLRPGIKRGNISIDEEDLIIRLHSLLGNRWSLIAGRLPGRTDNEIKNYWNTHLIKRLNDSGVQTKRKTKKKTEPKKKARAETEQEASPDTVISSGKKKNKKKKKKKKNKLETDPSPSPSPSPTQDPDDSNGDSGNEMKKIKVYVPKARRVCSGFSSNTVDSAVSSSSSHEEVNRGIITNNANNNNGNNVEVVGTEGELSEFDWPMIELGDANYDDRVLMDGCDFSFHDPIPTIANMLEQVYDEYLQLL